MSSVLVSIKPVGESAVDIDACQNTFCSNTATPYYRLQHRRASLITLTGAEPDNAPPRIVAAGRRVDHLVRVTGKWLIQLRDVSPKGIAALQSAKKGVWNSGAR
jgi:hypothetical protein